MRSGADHILPVHVVEGLSLAQTGEREKYKEQQEHGEAAQPSGSLWINLLLVFLDYIARDR
jgi:hypothetical protein